MPKCNKNITLFYFESILNAPPMRFDNSNSKLIKYQRGHILYFYAIPIAIATTTLKFYQFEIVNMQEDVELC